MAFAFTGAYFVSTQCPIIIHATKLLLFSDICVKKLIFFVEKLFF
jgi:hypothetical protein